MKRISLSLAAVFFVAAICGAQSFSPGDLSNFRQEGIASWYGTEFDGRPTASGEIFNSSLYTAAHPTLPFGTLLTVTNLNNGRKANVRVNDRGPFVSSRIIDLSRAAAQMLDMVAAGTAPVLVEALNNAYGQTGDSAYWAETNAYAQSEGSGSVANSQIIAPPYPVYQNNPYQSPQDPVVIQPQEPVRVQPQQQITQYFQQPVQPQPVQPAPQQPRQVQQPPPMQQIQPVQQVLPVQQVQPVIQPVQPITQPVIIPQLTPLPAQAAPTAPQGEAAPPQQQVQQVPLQIQIPIEVRPVISEPAAPPPVKIEPAPTPSPVVVTAPAPPPAVAAAPATVPPIRVTVKPNTIYRVQVGSFREARNALAAFEQLKGAGLNPVYERNGEFFRVVLSGIPSDEMAGILQKVYTAGFKDPLLREER
jgi:rare lipoprotein A